MVKQYGIMNKERKIISLVGLPAVGKTTTINLLKIKKPEWEFSSTELTDEKKRLIQKLYRKNQVNLEEIQNVYFENLKHHVKIIDTNRKDSKLLFLDRGFEDCLSVTNYYSDKGLFDNFKEFKQKYISSFTSYFSDNVIFLTADMNTIIQRTSTRNKKLNKKKRPDDDVFIKEISEYYCSWYKCNTNCQFIDTTDLIPEQVAMKIISKLEL